MQMVALPPSLSTTSFNYVDIIVVVWLIVGLFRGRKRGMSQELLPMLQWAAIVAGAGFFYRPFSRIIMQNTHFNLLWANVSAYVLIGFGIHLVCMWVKHIVGDKLVGSDLFGRAEYYMGMVAGLVRFACIWVVLCALMNSRIISRAELAQTEKKQSEAFSDIRFPTYGTIQQSVLFQSCSGRLIETNLNSVLIASVSPPTEPKADSRPAGRRS